MADKVKGGRFDGGDNRAPERQLPFVYAYSKDRGYNNRLRPTKRILKAISFQVLGLCCATAVVG